MLKKFILSTLLIFVLAEQSIAQTYPSPTYNNITVQSKTGYLKCNGASPCTAATTVPGADLASGATVTNLGYTPANKAGDTFSGYVTLNKASGALYLIITSSATASKGLLLQSAGANRWLFTTDGSTESGSNVGSNIGIGRYDDAGSGFLGYALTLTRSTGDAAFSGNVSAGASSYFNFGTTFGTSGYGFFDNAGIPQAKASGGAWSDIITASNTETMTNKTLTAPIINTVIINGAVPTGATGSCVASSFVGGSTAGKFSAAVCAAGTFILSGLPTAPNGYVCNAQDQTTPSDTLKQTANTVTSVTFTSTTVAADIVVYSCVAF